MKANKGLEELFPDVKEDLDIHLADIENKSTKKNNSSDNKVTETHSSSSSEDEIEDTKGKDSHVDKLENELQDIEA